MQGLASRGVGVVWGRARGARLEARRAGARRCGLLGSQAERGGGTLPRTFKRGRHQSANAAAAAWCRMPHCERSAPHTIAPHLLVHPPEWPIHTHRLHARTHARAHSRTRARTHASTPPPQSPPPPPHRPGWPHTHVVPDQLGLLLARRGA